MKPDITPEIAQAVHERECAGTGHDFDIVVAFATGAPVRIICGHCGRAWNVTAAGGEAEPGPRARAVCRDPDEP